VCGIVGIANRMGPIDVPALETARDALAHRGPDDKGIWLSDSRQIGLAHRRLSVIDLSDNAHQPMLNSDKSVALIFNGEIYNFRQLRDELLAMGYHFISQSDTEVIIAAYSAWGMEAFARFNGMFALAIVDQQRRKIILARDRFGEKPLYFSHVGTGFAFASELKALSQLPSVERSLDEERLPLYLLFGNIPYPDTIFKGVKKLAPAHSIVLDLDTWETQISCYWNMNQAPIGEGDYSVEALDALLTDSVRLRLIADVPVGAFLSGGIDSSLVVAIMARLQAQVKTYSIGFKDQRYDEVPHARAIANHLGCDHSEYYVSPDSVRELLVELPSIYDEPFADSSAIPTYIVSQFARQEVTVALTGDGGDELFGGYSTYSRLAAMRGMLKIPYMSRGILGGLINAVAPEKIRRHAPILGMDRGWDLFLYLNERTIAKRGDVEELLGASVDSALANSVFIEKFQSEQPRGILQAALYAEAHTYLVDDILTKVDRASMAVSLETRIPFLDHRIAEWAYNLPMREKMGYWNTEKKKILQTLLSRYIPVDLYKRPKHGFSVPLNQWFRGELSWTIHEYLNRDRIRREGIFQPDFVDDIVAEHMSGKRDREAILWSLVFWEMWRERWGI